MSTTTATAVDSLPPLLTTTTKNTLTTTTTTADTTRGQRRLSDRFPLTHTQLRPLTSITPPSSSPAKPTMNHHFPSSLALAALPSLSQTSTQASTAFSSTTSLHKSGSFSSTVSQSTSPPPALRTRRFPLSANCDTLLFLTRGRFVLRLFSVLFSVLSLALLAASLHSYESTKDAHLLYGGLLIWPSRTVEEGLDLRETQKLLAATAAATIVGIIGLAGEWWWQKRSGGKEDSKGVLVAAVAAVVVIAVTVAGMVGYGSGGRTETLMSWTCSHQLARHPKVDLERMCGELNAAGKVVIGAIIAEVLILVSAFSSVCIIRRRSHANSRKTSLPM